MKASYKVLQGENAITSSSDTHLPISSAAVDVDVVAEDDIVVGITTNKASWTSCYINLTSTVVGAGVLGLPHAYSSTGFILGTFLLIMCALSSWFSLHLLSRCAKGCGTPIASFYGVAQQVLPSYSCFIDVAVILKCFGVATSYLIVCGDLMPAAVDQMNTTGNINMGIFADRTTWVTIAFFIVAPLSCLPRLDSLKFTSLVSLVCIIALVVVIVLFAVPSFSSLDPCASTDQTDLQCHGQRAWVVLDGSSIRSLSIFVFAYTCQQNLFTLVNELKNPTQERIDSVISASIGTACGVFLVAGLCGYITYGDLVTSDLLKSYPELPITTFARICVSAIVVFHYPVQANPARRSLLTLLQHMDGREPSPKMYKARYVISTAMFLLASFFIAVSVSDLGVVLALVGASGSTLISYIIPGMFYYKMFGKSTTAGAGTGALAGTGTGAVSQRSDGQLAAADAEAVGMGGTDAAALQEPAWKRYLALMQCLCGVLLVPVCLSMIILDAATQHDG